MPWSLVKQLGPSKFHVVVSDDIEDNRHIVASVSVPKPRGGVLVPEVLLFEADENGKVVDKIELFVSRTGTANWEQVLTSAFGFRRIQA